MHNFGALNGRIGCLLVVGLLGWVSARPTQAQVVTVPPGTPVERVDIIGLETLSEGFVRRGIATRPGQPFSGQQLAQDVTDLLRTRKFIGVSADAFLDDDGRAIVVIRVQEKPELTGVSVEGNFEFDTEELFDVLPAPGQPIDRFEIDRGRDAILDLYRDEGYYFAEVTIDEGLLERERVLRVVVSEGPQVRIRDISFEGLTAFREGLLRSKVRTNTYIPLLREGAFRDSVAEQDTSTLERFYRAEGYLDAQVGYRIEFRDVDREELAVTFVIEEGPLYRVAEVNLFGAEAFRDQDLLNRLRLTPGAAYREEMLQADLRRLRDAYGEIGYVDAQIDSAYDFLDEPALLRLRFSIVENERSRIGEITIRGNRTTQDRVIRRQLRFFPTEDFNLVKVRQAERRLRESGLFTKVAITPLDDQDGFREALVEVEEADAVLFLVGAGVSTDTGLLGTISLENRNFDLFDAPRNFNEFVRGQSFRGAGQRLRIVAEPGTELTRFRVDWREPYLFDQPIGLGTSFYLFTRGRDAYDETRYGARVSLGRRFETGPLNGWAVEGAVRVEGVEIDDVRFLSARDIRVAEGDHLLTSLKGSIIRDTTDSRFRPTEGYRVSFDYEQVGALGGDATFGQPSISAVWYRTLHTDILDRKSVLGIRGDAGWILGDAPVFERFYGGGFGSIRGFEFRGVSPRDGLRDDRVGGEFILLTGAEYSFPLYADSVRGVTFVDMGTVEEGFEITGWRMAAGFGLRVDVNFFGPIPMVFDFGFPIVKEDEDDTQVFNFSFGASF